MMHRAPRVGHIMSITRLLKNLNQALVFNIAGERTKALEALANIARQANRILNRYDSGASSEVENQLTTPSPTAQMASSQRTQTRRPPFLQVFEELFVFQEI